MVSSELKKEILDLLEKDIEFRYAIAGYLGLSEIIKRLDRLEEGQNKIWENLNRIWENVNKLLEEIRALREGQDKLWENQNKLWEEIRVLREDQNKLWENQNKLWEEVKALREGQNKLWENQSRLWEEVKALREGQNKLWEEVRALREDQKKLWENQNKLWENVNKLWEEVRALREGQDKLREDVSRLERHLDALGARWGIMNEEAFRGVLRGLLGREFNAKVEKWEYLDREGYVYGHEAPVGIDIIIYNEKIITLEISSHIKASDVPIFKKKVELYEKVTGRKVSRLMFVSPFIDDKAKRLCLTYGIEIYTTV